MCVHVQVLVEARRLSNPPGAGVTGTVSGQPNVDLNSGPLAEQEAL